MIATVEGIDFEKKGFFCFAVPGNGTEGVFLGGATARGYEDGKEDIPANQVNVSLSPGDETEFVPAFTSNSENGKTALSGSSEGYGDHEFRTNGTSSETVTECAVAFEGELSGSSATALSLSASYTGCGTLEEGDTAVRMNGCRYQLAAATAEDHADIAVDCEEPEAAIEIEVTGICTLTIPEQSDLTGVRHYNESGEHHGFEVVATVEGIEFSKTGLFCFAVPGDGEAGVYVGEATFEGYEEPGKGQVDVSVNTANETE